MNTTSEVAPSVVSNGFLKHRVFAVLEEKPGPYAVQVLHITNEETEAWQTRTEPGRKDDSPDTS